ncbi:hypothetical protein J6590_022627 [Homalodisca vitripennis]|nr:hypothetical protein J6590_022627 [Homalodisca vitripennis]
MCARAEQIAGLRPARAPASPSPACLAAVLNHFDRLYLNPSPTPSSPTHIPPAVILTKLSVRAQCLRGVKRRRVFQPSAVVTDNRHTCANMPTFITSLNLTITTDTLWHVATPCLPAQCSRY